MSLMYDVPASRFGAVYDKVLPHDFTPGESDAEARARLQAEHRVRYDKLLFGELKADYPLYVEALQAWLQHEKEKLVASGVFIDDEMLAEAEILDEIIAEVNADQEDESLIKLAKVMKDMREAERELSEFHARHTLVA